LLLCWFARSRSVIADGPNKIGKAANCKPRLQGLSVDRCEAGEASEASEAS
jgi:hypothetical protein